MGTHIKTDKQCNFLRAKARWVLRGQDKQKDHLQTDYPASTRPGFRMGCQMAANRSCDIFHIDLKTALLQGQSYDVNRDVVCQLPPEAGHPPNIAARLKKLAYGMNDAPRRWWNILDKALRTYGMIPTRADRCCYVLYSIQSRERTREHWGQRAVAQQNGTKDAFTESRERSEMEAAFEKNAGSHSWKSSYRKIRGRNRQSICGWSLGNRWKRHGTTSSDQTSKRFPSLVQKIGTLSPLQDKEFAGHKIPKKVLHIEVNQNKAIEIWRKSQWCEPRRKTSIALPQCTQCTETYWDR